MFINSQSFPSFFSSLVSVLRLMLDGLMGRVVEVYQSICSLVKTDFPVFDEILCDLKLKPQDIDIPIPSFVRRDNLKNIKDREKVLDNLDQTNGINYECFQEE